MNNGDADLMRLFVHHENGDSKVQVDPQVDPQVAHSDSLGLQRSTRLLS